MLAKSVLAFAFVPSRVRKPEREETVLWQYCNNKISSMDNISNNKRFVWDNAASPMMLSLMRT
jgi:hypothetical protein